MFNLNHAPHLVLNWHHTQFLMDLLISNPILPHLATYAYICMPKPFPKLYTDLIFISIFSAIKASLHVQVELAWTNFVFMLFQIILWGWFSLYRNKLTWSAILLWRWNFLQHQIFAYDAIMVTKKSEINLLHFSGPWENNTEALKPFWNKPALTKFSFVPNPLRDLKKISSLINDLNDFYYSSLFSLLFSPFLLISIYRREREPSTGFVTFSLTDGPEYHVSQVCVSLPALYNYSLVYGLIPWLPVEN